MAEPLPELVVEGWRTGPYGPGIDPAVYATYQVPEYTPPPGGEFFSGGGAEPPLEPLNEVLVTAPKPKPRDAFVAPALPLPLVPTAAPAPAGSVVGTIASTLARLAAPLVGLLSPTPTASQQHEDAVQRGPKFSFTPYDQIDEVVVSGTAGKRPPNIRTPGFDPILPPNWHDMLDWSTRRFFYLPTFPIPQWEFPDDEPELKPDRERRVAPAPRPSRRDLPVEEPLRKPAPRITPRREPRVPPAPDVLGNPFTDPTGFPIGRPTFEPFIEPRTSPAPRDRVAPAPRVTPTPWSSPNPFASPFTPLDPFNPADPFRPPAPLPEPQRPIDRTDACNCNAVKEPKKKPKKKQPRKRCYRGTYTEKSLSLSKSPKEEVPCQ